MQVAQGQHLVIVKILCLYYLGMQYSLFWEPGDVLPGKSLRKLFHLEPLPKSTNLPSTVGTLQSSILLQTIPAIQLLLSHLGPLGLDEAGVRLPGTACCEVVSLQVSKLEKESSTFNFQLDTTQSTPPFLLG